MKKLMLLFMMSLFTLSLVACNDDKDEKKESAKTEESQENSKSEEELAAEAKERQKKLDAQKVEENIVVAIVNDQEIKGTEYNNQLSVSQNAFQSMGQDPTTDEMAKQLKEYTLENLVGQALIMQEVDKKGYEASEEAINKELETIKANYKDDSAFEKALKDIDFTLDELKKQISDNVKYKQFIEKDVQVAEVKDEDVKTYYDSMVKSMEDSENIPKYEEVKDRLKVTLEDQKVQEELSKKVEELRKNSKVELKI